MTAPFDAPDWLRQSGASNGAVMSLLQNARLTFRSCRMTFYGATQSATEKAQSSGEEAGNKNVI
jgi:hypothetical protein